MAAHRLQTALGALTIVGERADEIAIATEIALDAARRARPIGAFVPFAGARAYLKAEPLRGRARARWTIKRALFRRPLPRLSEYENLRWLRARLFQAPRPLCAGVFSRAGAPWFQFLLTQEVTDVCTLEEFLSDDPHETRASPSAPGGALRREVVAELAVEVARMHALGFIHHDLYPRNLLVARDAAHSRIHFVDAWAGGPPPQVRGAAYDLGCLTLDTPHTFRADELEAFFVRYGAERAVQDRPVDIVALVERTRTERERLGRKLRDRRALTSLR